MRKAKLVLVGLIVMISVSLALGAILAESADRITPTTTMEAVSPDQPKGLEVQGPLFA